MDYGMLDQFAPFALPPTIREHLNLNSNGDIPLNDEQAVAFGAAFLAYCETNPPGKRAGNLIDELTAMALPTVALALFDSLPAAETEFLTHDFRGLMSLGICAMLIEDHERALELFHAAQRNLPIEPAPYVNIARIYFARQDVPTALNVVLAGIRAVPNYRPLWDLLCDAVPDRADLYKWCLRLIDETDSWLGVTLCAQLQGDEDPAAVARELARFYTAGERDDEFLIEYTGQLGAAGLYTEIPKVVWSSRVAGKQVPWQLELHELQSFAATDQKDLAIARADSLAKRADIPDEVRAYLADVPTMFN
jgi:tetratricopeptide (TPR) repeat protein